MPHTGLAVIESRWWDTGNDSVRPLFETLAGIIESNPHAVRYDMFAEERSLANTITDISKQREIHSIYIGAHGSDGSICGLGDSEVSRTRLRNMFRSSNTAGRISGLYFGSCLVANPENASFWLLGSPSTRLRWVAGYTKNVDWVDSSAVDMIFWSKYLHERRTNKSRRNNKKTDTAMIRHAASEMKRLMPTVFTELGFNVYFVDGSGEIASVW
jgi:hypothetical protein